jgi:hypothetical protein
VGNQIYVTTDTSDVNNSIYSTGTTATGKLYTIGFNGIGTSTTIFAGASSAAHLAPGIYSGAGTTIQYTGAATTGGTRVDLEAAPHVARKLWLRTE